MSKHKKSWERSKFNCHHIIGKKNKDNFNVNLPENKIIVEKIRHEALNCLVRDKQDPRWQLEVMVNDWWNNVLWDKAKELFNALMSLPNTEFYQEQLVKKPYRKKNKEILNNNVKNMKNKATVISWPMGDMYNIEWNIIDSKELIKKYWHTLKNILDIDWEYNSPTEHPSQLKFNFKQSLTEQT